MHSQFVPRRALFAANGSRTSATPEGLALLRPVYWIAAAAACGAAFVLAGIGALTIVVAVSITLWSFVEARACFWLLTAFMVYLFVFFQREAPLGQEMPEEFYFWGAGIALITASLIAAALFSSQVDWALTRKRLAQPSSLAMVAMLIAILSASAYGVVAGNGLFAVARQLFGCMLLPVYFFLALALFRSHADVAVWVRRGGWIVSFGALWYVVKLLRTSEASGAYYREQSPLAVYAGAVALVALCEILARGRVVPRLAALSQLVVCILCILLMGSRSSMGSFLAGAAAAILLVVWKRHILIFALLAAALPACMGLYPYVSTRLLNAPGLTGDIAGRFIFVLDRDKSYLGRVAQTDVVLNTFEKHPVLGAGMGSENSFFLPGVGHIKVASVDNGWGYVLLKTGSVGLAAFLVLIAVLLKRGLSGLAELRSGPFRANRLALVAVFLYALVTFIGGPTFLHFATAPFFATMLGAMVVMSERREWRFLPKELSMSPLDHEEEAPCRN